MSNPIKKKLIGLSGSIKPHSFNADNINDGLQAGTSYWLRFERVKAFTSIRVQVQSGLRIRMHNNLDTCAIFYSSIHIASTAGQVLDFRMISGPGLPSLIPLLALFLLSLAQVNLITRSEYWHEIIHYFFSSAVH